MISQSWRSYRTAGPRFRFGAGGAGSGAIGAPLF